MRSGERVGILSLLLVLVHLSGILLFYSLRKLKLIKSRNPDVAMGLQLSLLVTEFLLGLFRVIPSLECAVFTWMITLAFLVVFLVLSFYVYLLFLRQKLIDDAVIGFNFNKFSVINRVIDLKIYQSKKIFILCSLVIYVVGILALCAAFFSRRLRIQSSFVSRDAGDAVCFSTHLDFILIFQVCALAAVIYVYRELRRTHEGTLLRIEVFIYICCLTASTLFIVLARSVQNGWLEVVALYGLTLSLMLGCVWIPTFSAIAKCRNNSKDTKLFADVKILDKELNDLLATMEGYSAFKEYLISEFSVENILFWSSVNQFRQLFVQSSLRTAGKSLDRGHSTIQNIARSALDIYRVFIDPDAPMCVNLSYKRRNALQEFYTRIQGEALKEANEKKVTLNEVKNQSQPVLATGLSAVKIESNVFDEAQEEIFTLMVSDSYRRFRVTRPELVPKALDSTGPLP